jgi:hypothetical protein
MMLALPLLPVALGFAAAPSSVACWTPKSCVTSPPLRTFQARNAQAQDKGGGTDGEERKGGGAKDAVKALSPLAMAAADYLEEEEDELSQYWNRFDNAKRGDAAKVDASPTGATEVLSKGATSAASTEELLDTYYQSRGIDKAAEKKYRAEIECAVQGARAAASAEEAVRILEKVRQYLQNHTRLGGDALLELAACYEAKKDPGRADEIYAALKSSPHEDIRQLAKRILFNPSSSRPKRRFQKGIWGTLGRWNTWTRKR